MKQDISPIEKGARNSIIWHLNYLGFTNSAIANIMNINVSTLSRIIKGKPKKNRIIDTVLFGVELAKPRK
jgi:predicted transcriptional regulator